MAIKKFKKFSDIKADKKVKEVDLSLDGNEDELPMNPNLPKDSKRIEKPASRDKIMPKKQEINLTSGSDEGEIDSGSNDYFNESKDVKTYGKLAKFPKNVQASKAYNFLENVKVSKKSIWYIMIEKNNELQMIKYNHREGVDLNRFVNELKSYYIQKYSDNKEVCDLIKEIKVDGNDKYSMIKDIPIIKLEDNKPVIAKITEDLIKLLSK